MLKDVVVNLSGRAPQDFAADYAISLATAFGAHVAGVAFLYEPVIPDGTLGGVPVDLIELQREENTQARQGPGERFEAATKPAGNSAPLPIPDPPLRRGAPAFAPLPAAVGPGGGGAGQPQERRSRELVDRGAAVESGRPVI